MNNNVKLLYMNIIGRDKNPQEVFRDWNRFKRSATKNEVVLPEMYPDFVKWVIKYQPKK